MDIELQKLTALFLEDSEKDIEITYQKLVDELDCPVYMDTTHSESTFLDLIRKNHYDVILADYTLPGYNAAAALKHAREICPDTPFIFVSGTIGEDIAVEMLKQGATDYVIKDRLERLPFAIRRAIEGKRLALEKKMAEQKIKEMSESNRLILDSTFDGIAMLDREYNILNINEIFAHRLGYAVADAIGLNLETLFPEGKLGECYRQRFQRFDSVFQTGQPEIFDDICERLWFHNRVYPVFKDGQVAAITLFSTDITDKIHAEEKAQKNALLNKEAEVLRQADQNKTEFLNVLSHELRNPLATIVAGFSLLDHTEDKEKIAHTKAIINRQISQLCRLVDDLLDIARITNNKIPLKKERAELNELVYSLADDYAKLFDAKQIIFKTETSKERIILEADPVRLRQAIGNLLHNALKFTEAGGEVRLTVCKDHNEAVIEVKDNGIGISPEYIPNLFEPFTQAEKGLDRHNGGLGLGLSIVKGIAELHGGRVSASSDGIGKGTTFVIRLPLLNHAN